MKAEDVIGKSSKYIAKVKATSKMLFSSNIADLTRRETPWFNMDDGSNRDCMMVMDNDTLQRMDQSGEIEWIKK